MKKRLALILSSTTLIFQISWAKEFSDLENVLNGSCKNHKQAITQYVSTGSLDEKINIAGERSYKNFFKQGTDVLTSYIENGRTMTPEILCQANFYAAAVTEVSIYWKDFAERNACLTSELSSIEELTPVEAEAAISMDNKPVGCNDQHWNAIVQNLQSIRNLDQQVSDYAAQNEISANSANEEVSSNPDAEVSETPPAPEPVSSPSPDIVSTNPADEGVKTEAEAGCLDCGEAILSSPAQSLQAEADKVLNEIAPDKSCCDIIKAMYLRNGRATKKTPLTDEGCKEVMAEDSKGAGTFGACVKNAIYGAVTNIRDSITALFDLGTYAAIPQLIDTLSTQEGQAAFLRNILKEHSTDMLDYWSCLKPGAAIAAKCEYISSMLVGIIGAGKFTQLVLAPIKSAKLLGVLGKTAQQGQRAAEAARVAARVKVYETARAYAKGTATIADINKAADAAGFGRILRFNRETALAVARTGRLGEVTVAPVLRAGQRGLSAATAPVRSVASVFKRKTQAPLKPMPKVQKHIKDGNIKGIRQEIKAMPKAQKMQALESVYDSLDRKQKALIRAYDVARVNKDKLKMSRYESEAKKLNHLRNAVAGDYHGEIKKWLYSLPRTERLKEANEALKDIPNYTDEILAQIDAAKTQKNVFKMKILNEDLERLRKLRLIAGAAAK